MKLVDLAAGFFKDPREEQAAEHERISREALDWISCAYHKRFVKWLDDQASKPLSVGSSHMDLVQAAVRANTLREMRAHLERIERDAQAAIRRE